ncbi:MULTISPECIES: hypothetical protein [Trichocoleus]|uniref:Uncharacterized protein n=1 Tax=Trichocoleus desertorum GB2-A4 TaxID=2933944 RepID=A0ABV0JJI9_9CYAN|nr:hypothetical protein [Trichocoleus sp. FACHB-46]MBD1865081.1 hypothetical protein [Trichocoleus sp. FACHB-46]
MTNSSHLASNTILANLMEADTALATQEAVLTTQLEAVREKRQSLKTVIDLFSIPSATPTTTQPAKDTATSTPITVDSAAPASDTSSAPVVSASEEPVEEKSQQSRSASEPTTSTKSGRAPKAAKAGRTPKQSKNWQDYLQPAFQKTSLPAAIAAVFQQQPQELLSVAALMNAIFVDSLPQGMHTTIRHRILNILSTGAKDAIFVDSLPQGMHTTIRHRILNILSTGAKEGQWNRGQRGQYSLSRI